MNNTHVIHTVTLSIYSLNSIFLKIHNHSLYFYIHRCLYDRTNIEHRISSPYHPQTNGLDERMNRTLVQTLTKLTASNTDWDQCIDAALYAYRIGVQDSSKFSPFFLMYNRQPRKAIDHEVLTAVSLPTESEERLTSETGTEEADAIIDELLDVRAQFHEKARNNIKKAQQRQKEFYDARHDSNHVSDGILFHFCCIPNVFFLAFSSWNKSTAQEYEEFSPDGRKVGQQMGWPIHS